MDFKAFDTEKMDAYARTAKEQWGTTKAYRQYEEKHSGRSKEEEEALAEDMMELFVEFGRLMGEEPESEKVQCQVRRLQEFITEHFYDCTKEILQGLGKMYGSGGAFTENIDRTAGKGCARFAEEAIEAYCRGH